jgi:hypothetical protein
MVSDNYQPKLTASVEARGGVTTIRITREGLRSLGITNAADQGLLDAAMVGQSMCPAIYWFRDTAEVRRLLGVANG